MAVRISRVPELVDTLLALYAADGAFESVALIDGPDRVNDYRPYLLFVGYRPTSDSDIPVTREALGGLRPNDRETVTVGHLVAAIDGNGVMKAARTLAAEKFTAVQRVLTTDPKLGLDGVTVKIGPSISWQQTRTDKGAEVDISFDVVAEMLL